MARRAEHAPTGRHGKIEVRSLCSCSGAGMGSPLASTLASARASMTPTTQEWKPVQRRVFASTRPLRPGSAVLWLG